MLARVDFSQAYWRWLYEVLYERVLSFGLSHHWTEVDVKARFARLILDDASLHLLTQVDESTHITAHCLVNFSDTVAFCEQMEADAKLSAEWMEECFKYVDLLKSSTYPTLQSMTFLTTERKYRAFSKKYGFTVQTILMTKDLA